MCANNHRSGGKIGGRHTTVIDAARPIVDFLLKKSDVTSVAVGHIKMGIKASQQRVKIREETGCLMVKIRGSASIQEIRVFSKNLAKIKQDLEERFEDILVTS